MTDSRLARRSAPQAPVQQPGRRTFGMLPVARSGLDLERALELAGVDAVEMALLASTTFKEVQSLEELVALIATTRRRGLDGMMKHVYYERFGGRDSDPSLHVAIDGLRAIAAATGEMGGRSEPRFSGTWDMPLDDGKTKVVPEKCSITVWRMVKGQPRPFDGVAWMEESYPGPSARGRMWRQRPRGMLSIAAERQAWRAGFPAETAGVSDVEDVDLLGPLPPLPLPPSRTSAENAAIYERIYSPEDNPALVTNAAGATVDRRTGEVTRPPEHQVKVGDLEADRLAQLVEEATSLDIDFDDLDLPLPPAPYERVIRATEKLQDRIDDATKRAAELDAASF